MIYVDELSYSFPEKELYRKVSFSIEEGEHIALIGSNGTGKSTLIDMLIQTDEYLYTGKITKKDNLKIGYVSQFVDHDETETASVYDYLCRDFKAMLHEQDEICAEMETATDFDEIMERYQKALDDFAAVDGDHYETNVLKQMQISGLAGIRDVSVSLISGGEYKLMQIIRQMMRFPDLLIMDEPDVFLDFDNQHGLRRLIQSYRGTILVITHNRYLLGHCFNKILHLENADIQEFEGSYIDYQAALLRTKIDMQEAAAKDLAEIDRQQRIVERLRNEATYIDNSGKGRQLKARKSILARLEAKAIKAPFVEVKEPNIVFQMEDDIEDTSDVMDAGSGLNIETGAEEAVISVKDYSLEYDDILLDHISFSLQRGDKAALIGPNGTGKSSLLTYMYQNAPDKRRIGYASQIYGAGFIQDGTVEQAVRSAGIPNRHQMISILEDHCLPKEMIDRQVRSLSGGERNLLLLALLGMNPYDVLLLDEPTSHMDLYSQMALERAIRSYPGTVLMVSHDFYTITGCVDYVLLIENRTVRRMSSRAFRKMIYKEHFDSTYIEMEKQKKELEVSINRLLLEGDYETAREKFEKLEQVISNMN